MHRRVSSSIAGRPVEACYKPYDMRLSRWPPRTSHAAGVPLTPSNLRVTAVLRIQVPPMPVHRRTQTRRRMLCSRTYVETGTMTQKNSVTTETMKAVTGAKLTACQPSRPYKTSKLYSRRRWTLPPYHQSECHSSLNEVTMYSPQLYASTNLRGAQ